MCNPPIHVSRCTASHTPATTRCLSPSFRPRPRMRGLASDRICKFEQQQQPPVGGGAVLYPVLGIGRSGCGHSSRAGGTFGQLWLVVRWTPRQPLPRNTALRRQQREYCQYYLSVPECFHQPAFVFDSRAENSEIMGSRREGKCGGG